MATWITHLRIVDRLLNMGLNVDEKGFSVGNIAPDCNVENEDWTVFTPSKEVTHWMKEKNNKLSADYEEFYTQHIKLKKFSSREEVSFYLGYYSHIIVDVEFQRFIRNDERVKNIFKRISNKEILLQKIKGHPDNFDTLKQVFGKQTLLTDVYVQDLIYIKNNPESKYNTVIKRVNQFPDYIDYLPKGAIMRKIGIVTKMFELDEHRNEFIYFTEKEMNNFVDETSTLVYNLISKKNYNLPIAP